ncbi:MAG: hypothetical protein WDN25_22075 [Acetobacteraceae bacterium]
MNQQLIVAPPRVDEVQIEVRTNGFVRPASSMTQDAPELLGEVLVEWTFSVSEADYPAFQQALQEAEKVLGSTASGEPADSMPDGVRYLGTYFVLSGGPSGAGRYRTLWGYRDFAAFQGYSDAAASGESEFAQALRLLTLYHDRTSPATSTTTAIALRAAGLRRVWDEPPEAAPRKRRAPAPRRR